MVKFKQDNTDDNIPLAIIAILLTVLALSLGDALVKLMSSTFVIWQIFVLRSVLILPVLLLVARATGARKLPLGVGWIVLRSVMLIGMWVLYYLSLSHLTLSAAAAAYNTLPIFIAMLSALISGERVGGIGWVAVVMGFAGVLLILRPDAEDFNFYTILPVGSAILCACAMTITRLKCRDQHPIILSLHLNIGFMIVGSLVSVLLLEMPKDLRHGFLFAAWTPMGHTEWQAIVLLALALLVGSIGAAIAYQKGPSAMIGTLNFSYVGFAAIWGFVFFGEMPDIISTLGMVMIIAAGVLSVRH